jgi:methylenetetrahydrofolate--tRNA-(uracil-5-)-methyltransferase
MGLLSGINGARLQRALEPLRPPPQTAMGALISHLTESDPRHFQPSNINFGLFPTWEKKVPKRLRGQVRAERSRTALIEWIKGNRI